MSKVTYNQTCHKTSSPSSKLQYYTKFRATYRNLFPTCIILTNSYNAESDKHLTLLSSFCRMLALRNNFFTATAPRNVPGGHWISICIARTMTRALLIRLSYLKRKSSLMFEIIYIVWYLIVGVYDLLVFPFHLVHYRFNDESLSTSLCK